MSGVQMSGVQMSGVQMSGVQMSGVQMSGSKCTPLLEPGVEDSRNCIFRPTLYTFRVAN